MRDKIGQGHGRHEHAGADSEGESRDATYQREHCRLREELPQDVALGRAHGLARTNLPGALGDGNQHDIHHADPAQAQRDNRYAAKEQRDYVKDFCQLLGAVHGVPDEQRIFVQRIKVANPPDGSPHLQYGRFMFFRISHFKHNVIQISTGNSGARLFRGREVARYGRIWGE